MVKSHGKKLSGKELSGIRLPVWETQETQVQSLGGEDPLGKEVAICSSILAWKFSWTQRSLADYSPWGPEESDTTERHFLKFFIIYFIHWASSMVQ